MNSLLRTSILDVFPTFYEEFLESSAFSSRILKEGKYTIDVPGVKKEDVDITLDGRRLTIHWKRGGIKVSNSYYVAEGTEEIKASLDLGVLTLDIPPPKKDGKTAKKIQIE